MTRVQRLAKMLSDQGLVVLVAILYSHPDLLAWNRENFADYLEVYLDAPLALVRSRDPKGIYSKAATGEMPHVVGLDVPWHAPTAADMVVDSSLQESPALVAERIAAAASGLRRKGN